MRKGFSCSLENCFETELHGESIAEFAESSELENGLVLILEKLALDGNGCFSNLWIINGL